MAKFPTEVERSITAKAPLEQTHAFLWDVVASSECIPGLHSCTRVKKDTYRFIYDERSSGPTSMVVQYTAHYTTDGTNVIEFEGIDGTDDNTDVSGVIRLKALPSGNTKITLRQTLAPDTPVPRLLQGFLKSYVEREAAGAVEAYLQNLKRALEGRAKPAN